MIENKLLVEIKLMKSFGKADCMYRLYKCYLFSSFRSTFVLPIRLNSIRPTLYRIGFLAASAVVWTTEPTVLYIIVISSCALIWAFANDPA